MSTTKAIKQTIAKKKLDLIAKHNGKKRILYEMSVELRKHFLAHFFFYCIAFSFKFIQSFQFDSDFFRVWPNSTSTQKETPKTSIYIIMIVKLNTTNLQLSPFYSQGIFRLLPPDSCFGPKTEKFRISTFFLRHK